MAQKHQEFYHFRKWVLLFIMLSLHICAQDSGVQNIVPIKVNTAQKSYQAEKNHNITLEFTFTTKPECFQSNSGKNVNWLVFCDRTDDNKILYRYIELKDDVSEFQDEYFSGRVVFEKELLRKGWIRLHVSNLTIEDSGCYECQLSIGSCFGLNSSTLNVTEPHPPAPPPATISPPPERRGRRRLYIAVATVFLPLTSLVAVIMVIYFTQRKRTRTTRGGSSKRDKEENGSHYGAIELSDMQCAEERTETAENRLEVRPHRWGCSCS